MMGGERFGWRSSKGLRKKVVNGRYRRESFLQSPSGLASEVFFFKKGDRLIFFSVSITVCIKLCYFVWVSGAQHGG